MFFELVGKDSWCFKESKKATDYMGRLHDAKDLRDEGRIDEVMEKLRDIIATFAKKQSLLLNIDIP